MLIKQETKVKYKHFVQSQTVCLCASILFLYLARFSVTLRSASCFLALFFAAASLAIFSPKRSLLPGSGI